MISKLVRVGDAKSEGVNDVVYEGIFHQGDGNRVMIDVIRYLYSIYV